MSIFQTINNVASAPILKKLYSATSVISDVINNFMAVDIVGFYDAKSLNQIFLNAIPIRGEVNENSNIMMHPLEDGTMVADHHVIKPVTININLTINNEYYNSTYFEIRDAWINGSKFLIKTRTAIYKNMIISDMSHSETVQKYNAIEMQLKCSEVLYNTSNQNVQRINNFVPEALQYLDTITTGLRYATSLPTINATNVRSLILSKFLGS